MPGQNVAITAGKFQLGNIGRFVYGKKYLSRSDAVELDPTQLKLSEQLYETAQLGGVFGVLRDASPDYWGRRIIERHAGKQDLNELDYLLFSSEDRAGALGFALNQTPPAPRRKFNQTLDLALLQKAADAIVSGEAGAAQVEELLLAGTSMGGARPKVVVEDEQGLWLAKFNRFDDPWNFARVEHAMLILARFCGLETAASRVVSVGGRDVLLVKRFDREKTDSGYFKSRMMSSLTLLNAEDTYQARNRWSYLLFAEELRRVSGQPEQDASELFRRMCFNALISNIDDHPRNLGVSERDCELISEAFVYPGFNY